MPVQLVLLSGSIVAEDRGVYVELEGHAHIAQFAYTIERLQSARHADLNTSSPKEPIRYDVDVAGPGLLRHGEGALVLFLGRVELLL